LKANGWSWKTLYWVRKLRPKITWMVCTH
jgi:hypothetical protein